MGFFDRFKKKDNVTANKTNHDMEMIDKKLEKIRRDKEMLEYERKRKLEHKWVENNLNGRDLEENGKIDEAIKCYEENILLGADTPYTYDRLAAIYHYRKEFIKERDILEIYVKLLDKDSRVTESFKIDYVERLNNVESFLNTGKWKYDCLPSDPKPMYYKVKEAKTLLNSEDKDKGIQILEDMIKQGTYNNTVYYTLYQTYKKDKRYDDCIRICNKAIEVLGLYSNDRKSRWNTYLEKITAQKDKVMNK